MTDEIDPAREPHVLGPPGDQADQADRADSAGGAPAHDDSADHVELSAADDDAIARLLATLPPLNMPSDVAARIDAEVTAAAVTRGTSAAATVVALDDRRHRRLSPRLLAAAAILIAVVAGSVIAFRHASTGPGPASAAVAQEPSPSGNHVLTTGQRYTAANLAAGIRTIIRNPADAARSSFAAEAGPVSSGSAALSPDTSPAAGAASVPGTFGSPGLVTTRNIPACLGLVQPKVDPYLVDQAYYAGQPALVVVYPFDRSQDGYPVYVVGARCGIGGSSDLLEYQLVTKP
jgi:hypothetical protein